MILSQKNLIFNTLLLLLLLFQYFIIFLNNKANRVYHLYDKKCNKKRVLVSGSSSNHFHLLLLMLYNVYKFEKDICFIIWDLGLTVKQNEKLFNLYSHLKRNRKSIIVIYNTFNYSSYPKYFNIDINAGEYAWKAIIISTTYYTYKKTLLWLDAGCNIMGSLQNVYSDIFLYKIWSISAGRDVKKYTYTSTLLYLNASKSIYNNIMCAGGVVGLFHPHIYVDKLLKKWVSCSLEKECIAPKYSNRSNHRQDQSAFTILLYQLNMSCNRGCGKYKFTTHFDYQYYKIHNNSHYSHYLNRIK